MMLFKRDGYYHLEYFDQSIQKLRRKSLKTKNKIEAIQRLTKFEGDLNQKQYNPALTLSKFHDEYVHLIKTTGTSHYLSSVELSFRKLAAHLKHDILLSELNRIVMEKYFLEVFVHSKYAAHLYYRTLKAAMNKAIAWGYLKENPIKGIKLPKIPVKHPSFVSEKELDTIVDCLKERDLKDITITAFYTGMRMSEILNLRWTAVNFTSGIITVQNSESFTTKSKLERVIPMHSRILEILHWRNNNSGTHVFLKNGVLYRQYFISHKFKKAVRQVGLPEALHFHSLRHSFASNLVQKGISLYVVKELLGHESIVTTQKYSHLQQETLKEAIFIL
ncbi:MAG: tyrosine-type recombinase/integrase [Bacteroidetes bacterium]|nr:tyrosine-type recombinase/integrase [Bacteroidota bacterium]